MKRKNFRDALTVNLSDQQRAIIEGLADRQETSLSCAARFILDKGITALGLSA